MTDIPSVEPAEFIAGNTVKWKISNSDYKASDSWVLTYALVKDGYQKTVTAEASGDDHLATISAGDSADYNPGTYFWQAYFTKSTERYAAGSGYMDVVANFADATHGHDARGHIDRTLEALEATIEKRATKDQGGTIIAGEQISKMPIHRVLEFYDKYKSLKAQQDAADRAARGLGNSSNVYVRFADD